MGRIFFGIRDFKSKSFTLKELGISEEDRDDITIERRQEYFHIYWIPVFPTGQRWALRKGESLYEVPVEILRHLVKSDIKTPVSIFAFALPLLAIIGAFFYFTGEVISDYNSKKRSIIYHNKNVEEMYAKIENTKVGDFYMFKTTDGSYENWYTRVEDLAKDSCLMQFPEQEINWSKYEGSGKLVQNFKDTPDETNLKWMSKEDLKKFINTNYETRNFVGHVLPITEKTAKLEEISHFIGPDVVDGRTGQFINQKLTLDFRNQGIGGTITGIKNIAGNINWTNELPMFLAPDSEFSLIGLCEETPTYETLITCIDSDKVERTYSLKGVGIRRVLTLLQTNQPHHE